MPSLVECLKAKLAQKKRAILLIDDDLHIIDTLKDILEDFGWQVATAGSFAEAQKCLSTDCFHVVVTDYTLPDASGLMIAQHITAHYPESRVVLMTGYALSDLEKELKGTPVFASLSKPVDPQSLNQTLESAMANVKEMLLR